MTQIGLLRTGLSRLLDFGPQSLRGEFAIPISQFPIPSITKHANRIACDTSLVAYPVRRKFVRQTSHLLQRLLHDNGWQHPANIRTIVRLTARRRHACLSNVTRFGWLKRACLRRAGVRLNESSLAA